jgi:hypothetical protein
VGLTISMQARKVEREAGRLLHEATDQRPTLGRLTGKPEVAITSGLPILGSSPTEGRFVKSSQRKNPYPCGFWNDPTRECRCTPPQIQRYVGRISGPLLDRIDIHIDVPAVRFKDLSGEAPPDSESSADIRERVVAAPDSSLLQDRRREREAVGECDDQTGSLCASIRSHSES